MYNYYYYFLYFRPNSVVFCTQQLLCPAWIPPATPQATADLRTPPPPPTSATCHQLPIPRYAPSNTNRGCNWEEIYIYLMLIFTFLCIVNYFKTTYFDHTPFSGPAPPHGQHRAHSSIVGYPRQETVPAKAPLPAPMRHHSQNIHNPPSHNAGKASGKCYHGYCSVGLE